MTIKVIDNKTKATIAEAHTNDFTKAMVTYIDKYRKEYTDATIEWYYTDNTKNNKPVSIYKTFE